MQPPIVHGRFDRLKAVAGILVALVLALWYFAHVFQLETAAPFTRGLGDWGDPYLINVLLEHWYYSAAHAASPASPIMFHPAAGTIGNSHSLVLYAPLYVGLRLFTPPFQAQTFMLFLVLTSGAFCLYLIARRFSLGVLASLLVSALFVTSANVVDGAVAVWMQRASVFLIPPIVLLWISVVGLRQPLARRSAAFAAGLLGVSLITHDLYSGAFAALMLVLFAGVPLLFADDLRRVNRTVRPGSVHRGWLFVALAALLLAILFRLFPLDRTSIGPLRMSVRDSSQLWLVSFITAAWYLGRRWRLLRRLRRTVVVVARRFVDIVPGARFASRRTIAADLVSGASAGVVAAAALLVWFYLPSYLNHPTFPEKDLLDQLRRIDPAGWTSMTDATRQMISYESLRPFAVVIVLSALALLLPVRGWRRSRWFGVWLLAVAVFVFVLPWKFDGISIWTLSVGNLPGFATIRDPKRVIYLFDLAVAFLGIAFLAPARLRRLPRAVAILAMIAILAATWRVNRFEYVRTNELFDRWVTAPIAIDPGCRSFFILAGSREYESRSTNLGALYGLDAAFVAFSRALPTLNGYTAFWPPDWDMQWPNEDSYLLRVRRWIARTGLRNVCAFDLGTRTMTPFEWTR